MSPYMLRFGKGCRLPLDVTLLGKEEIPPVAEEHVHKLNTNVKLFTDYAKKNITKAQESSNTRYDKKASPSKFKCGDHVFLKNNETKQGSSPKLRDKYLGPFYITKVFDNNTFLLRFISNHNAWSGAVQANQLKLCNDIRDIFPSVENDTQTFPP